jgi:hypothetical protein
VARAAAEFARCRPWLEAALEYADGTHTIEDVAEGVERGAFHFWPGKACAAVTQVLEYPRARFLLIFLAGGNMQELVDMIPSWKSWGAYLGCSKLTLAGRPGWQRVLGDWQREVVVLSTAIELGANAKEPADNRKDRISN